MNAEIKVKLTDEQFVSMINELPSKRKQKIVMHLLINDSKSTWTKEEHKKCFTMFTVNHIDPKKIAVKMGKPVNEVINSLYEQGVAFRPGSTNESSVSELKSRVKSRNIPNKKRVFISKTTKGQILMLHNSNYTKSQIAEKLSIPYKTVYNTVTNHLKNPKS